MLGAALKEMINESKEALQREVGKVGSYKELRKNTTKNPGIGQFINAAHQPPVSSILKAKKLNQKSRLVEAMLDVATNSSPLNPNQISKVVGSHGHKLLTAYVPKELHEEFGITKAPPFKDLLASAISKDDVVGTFKLMILDWISQYSLESTKNFQNTPISKTRLESFENSFQKHSTEMVETWFPLLQSKGVMTNAHLTTITDWINKQGYNEKVMLLLTD